MPDESGRKGSASNVTVKGVGALNMMGGLTNMAAGITKAGTDAMQATNALLGDVPGDMLNRAGKGIKDNALAKGLMDNALAKGLMDNKELMQLKTQGAIGQMKDYMGTSGATSMMARLGEVVGSEEVEQRPPFEFAVILKYPEKHISLTERVKNAAGAGKHAKDAIEKKAQSVKRASVGNVGRIVYPTDKDIEKGNDGDEEGGGIELTENMVSVVGFGWYIVCFCPLSLKSKHRRVWRPFM